MNEMQIHRDDGICEFIEKTNKLLKKHNLELVEDESQCMDDYNYYKLTQIGENNASSE
jgi:hypothetical protein